jgi:hypothetical protein
LMENFWSTLKIELVYRTRPRTRFSLTSTAGTTTSASRKTLAGAHPMSTSRRGEPVTSIKPNQLPFNLCRLAPGNQPSDKSGGTSTWIFARFSRYRPQCLAGDGSTIQQRHGGAGASGGGCRSCSPAPSTADCWTTPARPADSPPCPTAAARRWCPAAATAPCTRPHAAPTRAPAPIATRRRPAASDWTSYRCWCPTCPARRRGSAARSREPLRDWGFQQPAEGRAARRRRAAPRPRRTTTRCGGTCCGTPSRCASPLRAGGGRIGSRPGTLRRSRQRFRQGSQPGSRFVAATLATDRARGSSDGCHGPGTACAVRRRQGDHPGPLRHSQRAHRAVCCRSLGV